MRIYKASEVSNERFYQIPKSLFGNPRYMGSLLEQGKGNRYKHKHYLNKNAHRANMGVGR